MIGFSGVRAAGSQERVLDLHHRFAPEVRGCGLASAVAAHAVPWAVVPSLPAENGSPSAHGAA